MMKNYLPSSIKSKPVQKIINESINILENIGIPVSVQTERSLERMGMSFLALTGVKEDWKTAKSLADGYGLSSKDIIKYFNENFEDNISVGSYDSVPKYYIKLLIVGGFVEKSGLNPKENYNSKTRKYAITESVRNLVIHYNTNSWNKKLEEFNGNKVLLHEELKRKRALDLLQVVLPNGQKLNFSPGNHNELQKQIIESFLPRFGANCEVLYVGDGANKSLLKESSMLQELNFFDISHGMLPDIVAYSRSNNWLYLIEAFYSTGIISEIRMKELKMNLSSCSAEIIFITAFATKKEFQKHIREIAWETEVWTADNPDHMVHFNGHKFLGAY
jgi:type II restriction enzyme